MQNGKLRRLFGSLQIIPELFVITSGGRIAEIIHGRRRAPTCLVSSAMCVRTVVAVMR